jgi:lysophospholipase L1-like esterase
VLRKNNRKHLWVTMEELDYTQKLINFVGRSNIVAYYPWWEPSGSTLTDIVNGRNGTQINGTFGAPGIGDGHTACRFTGTGWANIDAMAAALNCSEFTRFDWVKVSAAGDWTDAAYHVVNRTLVDANNFVTNVKDGAASNKLYVNYKAGGGATMVPVLTFVSNVGWFNFGAVVSKIANISALLYNGARHDPRDSSGVWSGTPSNNALVSNADTSASVAWKGSIAHTLIVNGAMTEQESCNLVDLASFMGIKKLSILGDSISTNMTIGWQNIVLGSYNGGNARLRNHAVSGGAIVAGSGAQKMDAQVVAAAGDKANIIIIELGVNDDNAGNMTTLQAEYEENIAELKASNPSAVIYGLNVLPVWTNNTTGPEIDKSNIRTAISAAGISQAITILNGYTGPGIVQNDTLDGLHLAASGQNKLSSWMLTQI